MTGEAFWELTRVTAKEVIALVVLSGDMIVVDFVKELKRSDDTTRFFTLVV